MSEITWDIVIPNLGWIIAIISLVTAIWKVRGWFSKIDIRLKAIEENPLLIVTKNLTIEFWSKVLHDVFEKAMSHGNPLTPNELSRRVELTSKLDAKTIKPDEAIELRDILEKELAEARAIGNFLAVLAILFLLGMVIAILSD